MSGPKLFLDLDGVLVNLVYGVSKFLGLVNPYDNGCNRGIYNMSTVFNQPKGELWTKLSKEFWAELPWLPDGEEILGLCEQVFGWNRICLLSAPTDDASVCGKMEWIRKNLPHYWRSRQYLLGTCKHFAAEPRALLVDDCDDNADMFRIWGGRSILLPRPWNSNHAYEPIPYLEKLLK